MVNLATRGQAGTGAQALTAGFVLSGTGTKRLLIRAVGPTLSGFGVASGDLLADPVLTVASANGTVLSTNDDWQQGEPESVIAAATAVSAFGLNPGSKDAALIAQLAAGAYTASVSGKDSALGLALVEVYDLDEPGVGPRLVNLATRGVVGQESRMMIPGFVVSGGAPKTYLLRGVGPGLRVFNVEGALVDPVVTLYKGNAALHLNDDWSTDRDASNVAAAGTKSGAFALQTGSADAAFLMTLEPGAYTFQVSGKDGSGVAIAEIYEVP